MSMILQMVTCQRVMVKNILFRRDDRAYRVTDAFGMELLELSNNDLPMFRQTTTDRLAEDTTIIDLTGDDASSDDGGSEIVEREVGGKVISKKPSAGKTKAALDKEGKKSKAKIKAPKHKADTAEV